MKIVSIFSSLAVVALLAGCSTAIEKRRDEIALNYLAESNLIATNYSAADKLIAQAQNRLVADRPILVATLVKIDALDTSSTLGRVTSENIASRFTNAGYKVIEMKFGNSVYMKQNEGELVLTREITNIAKTHNVQGVVVGSYGVGTDSVFMNIKIVRPGEDKAVISSHDYSISRNREVDEMLKVKREMN